MGCYKALKLAIVVLVRQFCTWQQAIHSEAMDLVCLCPHHKAKYDFSPVGQSVTISLSPSLSPSMR